MSPPPGRAPETHVVVATDGSPQSLANQHDAGPIVVAAGGRGISDAILAGSTAQRDQHYAPCPVLVVRPAPRPGRTAREKH